MAQLSVSANDEEDYDDDFEDADDNEACDKVALQVGDATKRHSVVTGRWGTTDNF
jgi:hypothetical protein